MTATTKQATDLPLAGAVGGLIATIPMTVWILLLHKLIPEHQKTELPPIAITENLSDKVGLHPEHSQPQLYALSLLSLLGYGAATGLLYSVLVPGPSNWRKGVLWGLGVWATCYLGLMPHVFRAYPAATQEPKQMNAMMIGAHIIWGGVTGEVTARVAPQLHTSPTHQ